MLALPDYQFATMQRTESAETHGAARTILGGDVFSPSDVRGWSLDDLSPLRNLSSIACGVLMTAFSTFSSMALLAAPTSQDFADSADGAGDSTLPIQAPEPLEVTPYDRLHCKRGVRRRVLKELPQWLATERDADMECPCCVDNPEPGKLRELIHHLLTGHCHMQHWLLHCSARSADCGIMHQPAIQLVYCFVQAETTSCPVYLQGIVWFLRRSNPAYAAAVLAHLLPGVHRPVAHSSSHMSRVQVRHSDALLACACRFVDVLCWQWPLVGDKVPHRSLIAFHA